MTEVRLCYLVHDYEVFKLENTLFMVYSSNIDYAIRVEVLHDEAKTVEIRTSFLLSVDLPIVHSFRCHVNEKHATEVVCAFASDGYRIEMITLEKDGLKLKQKSKRSLKMFKNLSGLKMDFDEKILAISGNMFFYDPAQVTFENKFMPGIAIYNLTDNSDLIAGHISSKELGFNPTEHNHEIRIVHKHNVSLVGVRGHSGSIDLYELKDPEIIFSSIEPDQFKKMRLVMTSYKTNHYNLNDFFHLEGHSSAALPSIDDKVPITKKSNSDIDMDTSIPDVEEPKHHKKSSSHILIVALVLIFGGVVYYYLNKKKEANPGRTIYEMTSTKDSNSTIGDNSMFDKTE